MGHKQTQTAIIPQRPVPGVKQPFKTVEIGADFDLALLRPISPKAAAQSDEFSGKRPSAFGQKRTLVQQNLSNIEVR